MTNEEAIRRIKYHIYQHGIGEYPHVKLKEALDMAISALCFAKTGESMTNAKKYALREINNLVVGYIEDGPYENDLKGMELAVKINEISKKFCDDAYHPAHIDREAWTAQWEEDGKCDHKPYRVKDPTKWKKYKCSKCGYKAGRRTSQKYCPSCGKAMTKEAWEELKKRLMG